MPQDTPTAAEQQQARLARKAKRANDRATPAHGDAPLVFTHVAYPPYVPKEAAHSDQRYFSRNNQSRALETKGGNMPEGMWSRSGEHFHTASEVDVFRNATKDTADLCIEHAVGYNRATISIACNAAELREIANRLLDAAHDLDTLPAHVLAAKGVAA